MRCFSNHLNGEESAEELASETGGSEANEATLEILRSGVMCAFCPISSRPRSPMASMCVGGGGGGKVA